MVKNVTKYIIDSNVKLASMTDGFYEPVGGEWFTCFNCAIKRLSVWEIGDASPRCPECGAVMTILPGNCRSS